MMAARPASIPVADALRSAHLFGPHFEGDSWNTWRAVLKAAFAEPLSKAERATFTAVAERAPPRHRVKELVAIVGRGGGKDSVASFIAAYIAMSFDPRAAKLRAGERAFVMCLATDKDQAGIAFRYIRALFEDVPTLRKMVKTIGFDSIELTNRVVIQVIVNSYRAIRGRSVLAAIFDEAAFWRNDESTNPDSEVHAALAPGLARVNGSMLVMISSAYRRAGLLYDRWKACYGQPDDDVLVVRGTTTQFNPLFDRAVIDKALAADLAHSSAEYLSQWRDDLSTFISRGLLEGCIEPGVMVRPPIAGVTYAAFTDSSGARGDSFTAAVAHRELHGGRERTVNDCIYEGPPPFNPSEVIEDISKLLKLYRCSTVTGDNYAPEFVVEHFRKCGIRYATSKLDRSEIYLGFLPLITSGQVLLLDHPRAIAQFANLERRTFPSGKDRIDHGRSGHDDLSNAIAGAVVLASQDREQRVPLVAPIIIGKTAPPIPGQSTTAAFYEYYSGGNQYWGQHSEKID
jgi:hypothetical protein